MKIQKEILTNAIKRVMPGIGKDKTALVGMDTIILDKGGLHTFNGTICATVPMDTEGITGAVKGDKFFNLVQKFKADEVTLESTEKGLKISCGRNKSTLTWVSETKTPEFIEELHNIKPSVALPENFQEGLHLCDIPNNHKDFRGTIITGELMFSTDQNRTNIFKCKTPVVDEDGQNAKFWISLENASQLIRLNDEFTHYTTRQKMKDGTEQSGIWIHFLTKEGTIFSCTLLNPEQIEKIIGVVHTFSKYEKAEGEIEGTLPEGFKEAVQRVASLSSKAEDTLLEFVDLTFSKTGINIKSECSGGSSEEDLDWAEPLKEDIKMRYKYPAVFLANIYSKAKEFYLKDMSAGRDIEIKTLIFKSGSYTHLMSNVQDPDK